MEKNLNELVPEYNSKIWFIREYFFDRIKYAIKLSEVKPNCRICDIGCGNGILIKEMVKQLDNILCYGVDVNPKIKELSIPNATFEIVDIEKEKLPFASKFFDIVYAIDVLEHIKDLSNPIDEIYRVLKSGGILVVCGPTESLFYKLCRFLIKGTFSSKEGPASGEHFLNILKIHKYILNTKKFIKEKIIFLPKELPKAFAGVWIIKYRKK